MSAPEVGALVEVRYSGTVHSADDRGGFWLRVAEDCLTSALPSSAWVPAGATVKVLSPPRPREVLLLSCGHVSDGLPSDFPSGDAYCWRSPCHKLMRIERAGSVTW